MAHICIVSDGKPGHRNQSIGLAEALGRLRPGLQVSELAPLARGQALKLLIGGKAPSLLTPPDLLPPDLLIGAGHRTHLSLLALKRAFRAPAIVLMKPSLPLSWFDLCLIPEHDAPPSKSNVIATQGALNRMHAGPKTPGSGMILIGGPSKHSRWDEAALMQQLQRVLQDSDHHWCVTTSRRTPKSTERLLGTLPGIALVPAHKTSEGWLPDCLARSEACWVTEDSVSMVYEALTAGCGVGTLPVPGGAKRLRKGLQALAKQGIITPLSGWQGEPLQPPQHHFDEAARCAEQILSRGWI